MFTLLQRYIIFKFNSLRIKISLYQIIYKKIYTHRNKTIYIFYFENRIS